MWQDWTIAAVQWGFVAVLFATLIQDEPKPSLWLSVPTAVGMYLISFSMATLDLWWASTASVFGAVLWSLIAWQRWREIIEPEQWRREKQR